MSNVCLCAQVSDVYLMVQQTMTQPLMKDYVPFSWASMVQVKAEHFRALSHYYAAVALCDHTGERTRHATFGLRPSFSTLHFSLKREVFSIWTISGKNSNIERLLFSPPFLTLPVSYGGLQIRLTL